jgi:hypothetical protein
MYPLIFRSLCELFLFICTQVVQQTQTLNTTDPSGSTADIVLTVMLFILLAIAGLIALRASLGGSPSQAKQVKQVKRDTNINANAQINTIKQEGMHQVNREYRRYVNDLYEQVVGDAQNTRPGKPT